MLENISLAFQGIWNHKMRSFLTMLGIIIGIAAIITIVSTIKGTNEQIKANLIGAGTDMVDVVVYANGYNYDFTYQEVPEDIRVITEETRQTLDTLDGVQESALYRIRQWCEGVFYGNTAFNGMLLGVDSHYFGVGGYAVSYGRGFTHEDYENCRKVLILDDAAVSSLFNGENPIGKTMELQGEPFTVVGVVSQMSTFTPTINNINDYYMYSEDSQGKIFIPIETWPVVYRFDEPQNVAIRAKSTDDMTTAGKAVEKYLTDHQISGDTYSYHSQDILEQAKQLQDMSASTNQQLIWIASISLLVGGIGVMNIMLVSVTERTREIGLKKAIGAKRRRITWQFLTEAAVLTSIGGILGVLAGVGMAQAISRIMGTPVSISIPAGLVAVAFSVVIGIVFGLIPAVKASKLNPIDALRRE